MIAHNNERAVHPRRACGGLKGDGPVNNVSAIIITYNNEKNIVRCLEEVKWADEIIVVDSFSTDRTVEICKKYTNKVIQRRWEGFGPQK
jgi:glycosyltransferase involved in cell wall biosynthesis